MERRSSAAATVGAGRGQSISTGRAQRLVHLAASVAAAQRNCLFGMSHAYARRHLIPSSATRLRALLPWFQADMTCHRTQ